MEKSRIEDACILVEDIGSAGLRWNNIWEKAVYTKGKEYKLPEYCILNNDGFVLWYKESYYEVRDIDPKKTVSFLEVIC